MSPRSSYTATGLISSPPSRSPGATTARACGQRIADEIRRDPTSHVEGLPELGASDPHYDAAACRLWLCRGLQFEPDNAAANMQTYRPRQEVNVKVRLTIPHAGRANVSVVDTAADAVIANGGRAPHRLAERLRRRAPVLLRPDAEGPDRLHHRHPGGPERPVVQWWWYGEGAKQTYESCIDFTVAEA
ncbi:hypothetical protein DL771_007775 [Monosporascus sp. 5C6A]|nr:hypothetical protein DL771_007775 [Monosporascus sp. 5C6A]